MKLKKKILLIILCGVCLLGITGCGNSDKKGNGNETKTGVNGKKITDVKAEIVNNDGKKEKKSWSELKDLLDENNEYYRKHYTGSKIKVIDTIESIKKDYFEYDIDARVYELELSGGWYVYIDQNQNDLSDVLKGTKVEIESFLYDNSYWPIIHGTYSLPEGEKPHYGKAYETTKTTIKVLSN